MVPKVSAHPLDPSTEGKTAADTNKEAKSGEGDKVIPEFSRVRQIFVMVTDDPALNRANLEAELKKHGAV